MTEPDQPVHPLNQLSSPLTKREYFAAAAMQGLSANCKFDSAGDETIVKWSVNMADALISALNKQEAK